MSARRREPILSRLSRAVQTKKSKSIAGSDSAELGAVFETLTEGLVIQGCRGEIQKFNSAALAILGLSSEQLQSRTLRDPGWTIINEDGAPLPYENYPATIALRTGKPVRNVVMGLTLPHNEVRWIRINSIPIEGKSGRKVASTFTDVSDAVRSNSDMRHIFSHSMDLICIASTDGTFKKVSPSFTKILGYEEKELLSRPFVDFIHPDDLEATGRVVATLSQGLPLVDFENRYRTRSGEYKRISWVCEPDPKTGLLYASGRDVTKQRETEHRNQQIFKAIDQSAIVAFTDERGRITQVNDNFCAISGYSREELIGKDHRILNSGSHPKSFFKSMWTNIKAGRSWTGDIENRKKNGEPYFVRSVITPIKNVNGEIEQFMAVRFDITESAELQKKLEFSKSLLSRLINQSSSKIFLVDETTTFHLVNERLSRDFGCSPEEVVGKSAFDFFPPHVAEQMKTETREVLRTRKVCSLEHTLKFGNQTRTELVQQFPIENVETGQILVGGIVTDVTALKKANLEVEATKNTLQGIIDASPSTIFVKDLAGKYLICNAAYARALNKTPSEIVGRSLFDLFPAEAARKMAANDQIVIQTKASKTFEEQIPFGGAMAWHLVSLFPVLGAGGVVSGVGGIITNIQEAKDTKNKFKRELDHERAKSIHNSKLASLGEMSAGIAHEINNPLGIISGTLALLKKIKDDPEKFDSKLDSLSKAVARIEKIVKGLKKFSRSSEGSVHKNENLLEIVGEALTLIESKSKRHNVTIAPNLTGELWIHCDAVEIEQVLVNLMNNAIDAVKDRQEKWVKINCFDREGAPIVQVIDSGGGISEELEAKIFHPFFTTKPVGEGTGLGLSISKGILDQHKAKLHLNREFKNTCFEIIFPRPIKAAA